MNRCKHERAWAWRWTGDGWATIATIAPSISFGDRMTCVDCGHWLSLGPANDGGEHAAQVAVEIAAAHRASERDVGTLIAVDNAGCITTDETGCRECQTWYLARAIATHTEET